MRFAAADYRSIVFDCDGVILDSNRIKSDAFFGVSRRFGEDVAARFVRHHRQHGGVSRYCKFAWLLDEMLRVDAAERDALLDTLLKDYGTLCADGLRTCALIPGVRAFLDALPPGVDAFVVTGGDQAEVRTAFADRGLDRYFRAVLGSPAGKRDHMIALARSGAFESRSMYFGDAELDMRLADEFGLEFLFVSGASEWKEGRTVCIDRQIRDFTELA